MMDAQFWTLERVAGLCLIASNLTTFPGLIMFWLRAGHRGGKPPNRAYYIGERAFIMAGIVFSSLGFMVLQSPLQNTAGDILARIGAMVFLFAGILGVIGESLHIKQDYKKSYPIIVVYVVLAFLSQAAMGGALLQAGWVAGWLGGLTIVWNIGWLIVLPLITPRDIYFPVLHYFLPLLIGTALVVK
jgi:hypothetical protein